jgi:hypothetical protein
MKNVSNKVFSRMLSKVNACGEAREWVKQNGGDAATLFQECERGDWMAWIIAKMELVDKRQLVGALADVAALSLKYYETKYPKDKRVRECINICRRYAKGKATDEELKAAADAAYAAAYAAAADAYAAAYAADAAYAARAAARAAAYAAYAAYAAAADAAYAAAYAADAAAYAAYAARAAAYAAAYAAYAARAAARAAAFAAYAAYVAADAAYVAARMKSLKKSADIIRKHFPDLVQE